MPRRKQFRMKEFQARESLLKTLLAQTDLACLKNFFCAIFLLIFLKTIFEDVVYHSNPVYHLWLIMWNFEKFLTTMLFWTLMAASTLLIYYLLRLWSRITHKNDSRKKLILLLSFYIIYLCGLFYCCIRFVLSMELPCACTFIITCENTRIVMKVHSFMREVYPLVVRSKVQLNNTKDEVVEEFPSLEQYVYFFFCPSLVFRHFYPRSPSCNWQAVRSYVQQIILIIYCVNLIFIQMILPQFESQNLSTVTYSMVISSIFVSIFPGALCLLLLFYGLLHCWLNMFAELLHYADRQFYLNWWSSKSMTEYYRNWNLVVHEWLYAYIYRDITHLIGGRKGLFIAQTAVFFLSSAFHEYWFGLALRMFYPIIFISYFIFGGIFHIVSQCIGSKTVWNIAMYMNLLIGTGIFISFYGHEWYARQRCVPHFSNPILDILTPRHWFCTKLIYS